MDDETAARFAVQEAKIADLARQLDMILNPLPRRGVVLSMGQAVHKYGWSRETLRRRATTGEIPGAVKRCGRWQFIRYYDEPGLQLAGPGWEIFAVNRNCIFAGD